jgi:hypothetical protein
MNRQPARSIAPGVRHLRWSLQDEQAGAHRCIAQRPAPVEELGVGRQATLERGVRGRLDTDLTEDPALVDLAGRGDDPSEHEITKHGVALGNRLESQRQVGSTQPLPQMGRLRRPDQQRTRFDRQTELDLGLSDGAPDTVFTVRTKATSAAYDPALVFKFDDSERNTAG